MIEQSFQSLHEKRTQILTAYFQAMDDLRTLKQEFSVNREHSSEEKIAYQNTLNDLKRRIQDFQFELTQVRFLIDKQKERRPKFKPGSWRKPPDDATRKPLDREDQSFQEAKQRLETLRHKTNQ